MFAGAGGCQPSTTTARIDDGTLPAVGMSAEQFVVGPVHPHDTDYRAASCRVRHRRATVRGRLAVRLEHPELDSGAFDLDHYTETHRRLFQDVYDWAGKPRTVELSKGESQFLPLPHFDTAALSVFGKRGSLARSGLLNPDVDDEAFVKGAASLLEQLNYLHMFREGNGRTQRTFLDQVAAVSGRHLTWRNVTREENHQASVRAFNDGSGAAFEAMLRKTLEPPMDGLSYLSGSAYTVSDAVSPDVIAERRRRFPELFNDSAAQAEPEGVEFERE